MLRGPEENRSIPRGGEEVNSISTADATTIRKGQIGTIDASVLEASRRARPRLTGTEREKAVTADRNALSEPVVCQGNSRIARSRRAFVREEMLKTREDG